jgi:hypothetical protein
MSTDTGQQEETSIKGPFTMLGKGHPNITLERDYRDPAYAGWNVRVETLVPIDNEPDIRKWLEDNTNASIKTLANSILDQVPDAGDQLGARHMVAAAFGFELGRDNRTVGAPRS